MSNDFIYQSVTDRIITMLETCGTFEKPWIGDINPHNPTTKKDYNGINTLLLAMTPFKSNHWASFKQWQEKGATVRKGEKSTMIVFWKMLKKNNPENPDKPDMIPLLRYYNVFNAEQV